MRNKYLALVVLALAVSFQACKDDDDSSTKTGIAPNGEELITNVNVIFSDTQGMALDTFSFVDLDGDGGNAPTIDTIRLNQNTTYNVSLEFLDASDPNDVEDVTVEIKREDDEHLICFQQTNVSGLTINRTDSDGTYEVGLTSQWTASTSASSSGVVQVVLRHQPEGAKDGTCTPGESDVEIDFPVRF